MPPSRQNSESNVNARERLILALDVSSLEEADRLLDQVEESVQFVKIGLELFTTIGPRVVQRVLARGKRVFLDLKFLDIEETVRRATAQVAEMGVEFLTVHANRKALKAAPLRVRARHVCDKRTLGAVLGRQ